MTRPELEGCADMRKRLTAVALAGTVGLGAVGAAAYPAFADSTSKTQADAGKDHRTAAIKEALKGLVADKTLTQAQADRVADTLGEHRGGFGPRPGGPMGRPELRQRPGGGGLLGVEGPQADAAAAKVLGLSVEDLRTALGKGSTLAELAKKQGKDVDTLVDALVTVAKARLAESVKSGRLSQETADRIDKTLEQRVRTVVQNGRPAMGMRWHMKGEGRPPGAPGPAPEGEGTPPAPPAPKPAPPRAPSPGSSADSSAFTTT